MKKVYFETEETKTTKKKGWLEIDTDYTQLYSCFNKISSKIYSVTSFKLLFWLLAYKANDSNGIDTSTKSFEDFNKYLVNCCGKECAISYRTFSRCITDLKDAGALTQVGKGHYYANPSMFWKADTDDRENILVEEYKDKQYQLEHPKEKDLNVIEDITHQ